MTGADPVHEYGAAHAAGGPDALEEVVRSIGGHARAANLARAHHLADAVGAAELLAGEGRRRAADLAHQIVGSAGTFGFPLASVLAADIERLLVGGGELDAGHLETMGGQVQALLADLKGEPTF